MKSEGKNHKEKSILQYFLVLYVGIGLDEPIKCANLIMDYSQQQLGIPLNGVVVVLMFDQCELMGKIWCKIQNIWCIPAEQAHDKWVNNYLFTFWYQTNEGRSYHGDGRHDLLLLARLLMQAQRHTRVVI